MLIGGNVLGLYPYERVYFFGGAGLIVGRTTAKDLPESHTETKFNVTAGAGFHINDSLFAEARWSHQTADFLVTVGFKIY